MTDAENLAAAKRWAERFIDPGLISEGASYRYAVERCADALVAAVRAKGEEYSQVLREIAKVHYQRAQLAESVTWEPEEIARAWHENADWLLTHAADVPEPPR